MSQVETGGAVAILGAGGLGQSVARGWVEAGRFRPDQVWLCRRRVEKLSELADEGFAVTADPGEALAHADTVVLAVLPQQLDALIHDIGARIEARHRFLSLVSGVTLAQLGDRLGGSTPMVRVMPNTAVAIRESMTCLCAGDAGAELLASATDLFDALGRTLVVAEEMMVPATALCACGIAFFLRSVRAASQGGIEIGFHPEEALLLAAQTAKGAAALLGSEGRHPEAEIDRVTSPRGCTIAGLNEMEHQGLSSALIKGILTSARKAEGLFPSEQD